MEYKNPLISRSLSDKTTFNADGQEIYCHDCHNLPICKSYGQVFIGCLAGANSGYRCSRGEKMQIRILNDMNHNAIHKPEKPSQNEIEDYIKG